MQSADDNQQRGLYDPLYEHDACGVGWVANLSGARSHKLIEQGIEVLRNLAHRGALGADSRTGDGAGLLFQLPDSFLRVQADAHGFSLPPHGSYGMGMFFMPDADQRGVFCRLVESVAAREGLTFLGWREVPTNRGVLGHIARRECPAVLQGFFHGQGLTESALERRLYVFRRCIEKAALELPGAARFYIPSLSCRTVVYKGLMMADQVAGFYPDLADPDVDTGLVVIHQRYSTNTFPSWPLAQPFRYLAHNGEINTLRGNINQMRSRERNMTSEFFGPDISKLFPIIQEQWSDSACLDAVLELLHAAGRTLEHSMLMLIPQAWGTKYPMGPDLRGFFEYHAGLMEPWDGPAAVAFTDGVHVGSMLDRNGLRPARYTVTKDGFVVMASETGVLDIPPEQVREKGALRPGQIIVADLERGRLMMDCEIKMRLARRRPYRRWVEENRIDVHGFFGAVATVKPDDSTLQTRLRLFGYTREDVDLILGEMAAAGSEPRGSMGSDQPLAVFSEQPQLLYWYFKQMFAQVTNPAIDPTREELVMSLMTFIGNSGAILDEVPGYARLVKLRHPILANEDMDRIRTLNLDDFRCHTIAAGFPLPGDGNALKESLDDLCQCAEMAVDHGNRIIVLSDRNLPEGVVPIPMLIAVSAVNKHLAGKGLRTRVGIVAETGEAREVMHLALLLGYGASAVNPYLAFEAVADLAARKRLEKPVSVVAAVENYIKALCKGLLKIMSRMGISTLRSYRNAQVFEAIGLSRDLVSGYFEGTTSRIGGIGLSEIAAEAMARYNTAYPAGSIVHPVLASGGQYRYRLDGERHMWTPETISLLQRATREGNVDLYRKFAGLINDQQEHQSTLRGLLSLKPGVAIPVQDVEPASEIVKRFATGAMSFGSLSREAHETLAVAMNRMGAMSNSGEGGEDPERYKPLPGGDSRCSKVKQVASGRFGVTAEYLVNARELQIKIAQGAKPGEGGHLPGHKVNAEIARVRNATPGVTLISPPPHHDIYSIEDIAQLIYDLKNANTDARISVKLVSEAGVGTVAAGVAKGHADMILISGYDGGTGASPLSSIKHAGAPWELGLAETQQVLVRNGLRNRVRLQVDGQLRTGWDVLVGALLGAEEFGFATAALVVCGCVMMRQCHANTCPVGVATQDPELRKRFRGKPEYVVRYFNMVAEELRAYMSELGVRTVDELVGRTDLLDTRRAVLFWKARNVDLSGVLTLSTGDRQAVRKTTSQDHGLANAIDHVIIPKIKRAIEDGKPVTVETAIRNVHRTVGTIISGNIARKYGSKGLADDTITLKFKGVAGQSFGAFASRGMTMLLEGEANDYLGKGLSGARIVVTPPAGITYEPSDNIIAGNVLLYGATSGEVYIHGRAGERFAIRNSGATAVVEGVGDHGCEYMTGGRVVVLGPTGVNFGAGMSGGIAYVYDETGMFDGQCNLEMIDLELVGSGSDEAELKSMLERHLRYTGSRRAGDILENWQARRPYFIKVFPMEYKKVLGQMSREDVETRREVAAHE